MRNCFGDEMVISLQKPWKKEVEKEQGKAPDEVVKRDSEAVLENRDDPDKTKGGNGAQVDHGYCGGRAGSHRGGWALIPDISSPWPRPSFPPQVTPRCVPICLDLKFSRASSWGFVLLFTGSALGVLPVCGGGIDQELAGHCIMATPDAWATAICPKLAAR